MKKHLYLIVFAVSCIFSSCEDNKRTETITYKINEPIFISAEEFRNSVKLSTIPHEISKQGKICFYEGYLYISEPEKGIHILDNRNPAVPKSVGFIELIGNIDLIIHNNTLYADSYIDLVWFDISNPEKPEYQNRIENVFKYALPIIDNGYGYDYAMSFPNDEGEKNIVVGWTLKERTETIVVNDDLICDTGANGNTSNNANGKVGSMSRFGIYEDFLYTVLADNNMSIFDLKATKPEKIKDIYTAWGVETIFSYKDYMFMGTPNGMLIYSVKDPINPIFESSLQHVYGCDPVVVENDLAYITIRSGNNCGQGNNELFIVDVSDVKNPKQIVSYTMENPKGLGIDNGILFLCDDGLKIYKVGDPQKLITGQLAHYKGMDGFDVIPNNNILMMIANDGIYQYDYTDLNNIKELSKFRIGG